MNLAEAGTLIKAYRKRTGMTQAQIAQRLGMGRSTISLIESGMIPEIGLRKYAALCDLLGLSMAVTPLPAAPTWSDVFEQKKIEQEGDYASTTQAIQGALTPRKRGRHA